MEICSPLFFLYVLYSTSWGAGMGTQQRILTAAFLVHYSNRAYNGALVRRGDQRGPQLAPRHLPVILYPLSPSVGLTLWAVGFVGNVTHDEILVNIRRNLKDKRDEDKGKGKEGKGEHYAIPHRLLFSFVSFPNYLCEWIEWFGFSLATDPRLVQSFSFSSWLFMIADLLIMTPRAYRGHLWYRARFGDAYPKDRKIIVPFLL
ncbi:3-oxo-5-alpha-steroid 4-dehydrogenase-domain-containing protein [Mycena vulgaris]|nr:3-oxo-5-alpha-steroid 4-dehydrogenase-domain-containing protein [Mycena vulgaris]